jgi:hypothetical protein
MFMGFPYEYWIYAFTVISALCCVVEKCKSSVKFICIMSYTNFN